MATLAVCAMAMSSISTPRFLQGSCCFRPAQSERTFAGMAGRSEGNLLELLPDDLLLRCLSYLALDERHKALPLVCRRLRSLVEDPGLNASVDLRLTHWPSLLRRLDSLCSWVLAGAAAHIRRLVLHLPDDLREENDDDVREEIGKLREEDSMEGNSLLATLLTACSSSAGVSRGSHGSQGGGGVRELHLHAGELRLCCSGWVGALRRVRRLSVSCNNPMPITSSLHGLAALEELCLDSYNDYELELMPTALLPPSITRLHLGHVRGSPEGLPTQVASLTRLHSLSLWHACHSRDEYSPLSHLTSLRRLSLTGCDAVPDFLPQMTGLEALSIDNQHCWLDDAADGETVQEALRSLEGLTFLVLGNMPGMESGPPAALTCLTRLGSFQWNRCSLGSQAAGLPPGRWLAGLARLAAPSEMLASSLSGLDAAHQLTHLAACMPPPPGGPRRYRPVEDPRGCMRAVLQWAGRHPTLRTLEVQADEQLLMEAPSIVGCNARLCLLPCADIWDPDRLRERCMQGSA